MYVVHYLMNVSHHYIMSLSVDLHWCDQLSDNKGLSVTHSHEPVSLVTSVIIHSLIHHMSSH